MQTRLANCVACGKRERQSPRQDESRHTKGGGCVWVSVAYHVTNQRTSHPLFLSLICTMAESEGRAAVLVLQEASRIGKKNDETACHVAGIAALEIA